MHMRGRKRQIWVPYVLDFVINEFYHLLYVSAKMNRSKLLEIVRHAIRQDWFPYGIAYLDPVSGQPVNDMADKKILTYVCERYNLLLRLQYENEGNR